MRNLLTCLVACTTFLMVSCKKETASNLNQETVKPQATATDATLSARFSFETSDPISIFENQSIKFINLSSGYKTCVWEFGNTTKTQDKQPTISYPMHGYHTVKLTVIDDKGNKKTTTQDISILCLYYNGVHP